MFPRNNWYVAANSAEITEKPISRLILGERLVMFRTVSGRAVALKDECPHRMLPLSLGRVVGENIQCGYHGAEFSCTGECVNVPGQAELPETGTVHSYPVQERYGVLWVWLGDADQSSLAKPCQIFSFIDEGKWDAIDDYIHIACDYQLVNDNLADTTHTQFVHPTTLGNRKASKLRSAKEADSDEMQVSFSYEILEEGMEFQVRLCNTPMAPTFENGFIRVHGGTEGENLDFQLDFVFHPPSFWIFSPTTMRVGASEDSGVRFDTMIFVTPETDYTSHYFYKTCQKYAPDKHSETEYWHDQATQAFYEDKVVLEAQQQNVGERDIHDYPIVSFRGDMIGFQVRKFVRGLMDGEPVNASENVAG